MKEILNSMVDIIKNNSKKIKKVIIITVIVVIGGSGIAAGAVYSYAKSNINYSEKQLKEAALKKIPGQVINVKKELEIEDATFEYTLQIKDAQNMLQEITLSSKSGVITDIETNGHDSDDDEHENYRDSDNSYFKHQK